MKRQVGFITLNRPSRSTRCPGHVRELAAALRRGPTTGGMGGGHREPTGWPSGRAEALLVDFRRGDIRFFHGSSCRRHALAFFTEYTGSPLIHNYPKPYICLQVAS